MDKFTEGQLIELCQMVYHECKPCAMIPIKKKDKDYALHICNNDVYTYIEDIDKKRIEFWMFKRIELLDVIKLLPDNPQTKADHYLLGALFGYSNNAICDYLNK
jgi:hypothetical protein